ncbi:MAG: hypothetical protein JXA95_07360 [Spirochaetales bacterium]|nr:hypothetical protein [Spirochaetales bacterium]
MILDLDQLNIYVKPGCTDMRKQINGLSAMEREHLEYPLLILFLRND